LKLLVWRIVKAKYSENMFSGEGACEFGGRSAIVPQEKNYLLNPRHNDFQRIIFNSPQEFRLDTRLVKKQPSRIQQFMDNIKFRLSI
jgi:RES domain-containing protein